MALLFCDSFNHYATADILKKWSNYYYAGSVSINASTGRHSSNSLRIAVNGGSWVSRGMPFGSNTAIVGCAVYFPVIQETGIMAVRDGIGGYTHVWLRLNSDGSLSVWRVGAVNYVFSTGTLLGTSAAGVVTAAAYHYIEFKTLIAASSGGTATVRVNGSTVLTLTSQTTQNTSSSTGPSQVALGTTTSPQQTIDFSDFYVCDNTGSYNNDFLGDIRVDAHTVTANGTNSGSTPSTGTNRALTVDEATPNDDTDYNSLAASGDKDTMVLQDLIPAGAAILGMQTCMYAKKTDAGVGSIADCIRTNSTDYDGTTYPLSTVYKYYMQMHDTDPYTGVQPVETDFNAYELGYKRTA